MKKFKRASMAVILLLMVTLLCSCSLAKKDLQKATEGNHLCGAFIVTEAQKDQLPLEGKYYADCIGKGDNQQYEFNGLPGFAFFYGKIKGGHGVQGDAMLQDKELAVTFGEEKGSEKTENAISATLFYTKKYENKRVTCIPIRKDQKGYYIDFDGDGRTSTEDIDGMTLRGAESWEATSQGNGTIETLSYAVRFQQVDEVKSVVVKEMNNQDQVVAVKDIPYKKGGRTVKLSAGAFYAIIEETCVDADGKAFKKHSARDPQRAGDDTDTSYQCNFASKEGIVVPMKITIKK